MFRSLRSKLIASHVLVIVLAFLVTAVIASVPVRRAQQARTGASLVLSAESVARQLDLTRQLAPRSGVLEEESLVEVARRLIDAERRRSGNRLLVIDPDASVLLDTSTALEGQTLSELQADIARLEEMIGPNQPGARPAGRIALALETHSVRASDIEERRAVIGASAASSLADRPAYYVVAIAPRATPVIDDVVRPLTLAALIGIAVSILVALLFARTITSPLRRLGAAVASIRANDLDQRIQMDERGEVGTLVEAFNGMLERIAATYHSQRGLLANIAHELRTPLTSIQGYALALRDGLLTRENERDAALEAISEEAGRMAHLVEQILQLSRLESGQLPLVLDWIEMDAVLRGLERQFAPLAAERDVRLAVDGGADIQLEADPELLLQALGNLVANALRHTPAGGEVRVTALRIASANRPPGVRLTVADTGEGIPGAQLEHIFERFYRGGEQAASRSGRNFGLGLAIVHEIVERHGGEIGVQSAPGQGAVFTLDLPRARERDNAPAS